MRPGDGAPRVQDGPYADTKEQLGGLCVIDVPDVEAAQASGRAPFEHCGVVEVRPTRVVPTCLLNERSRRRRTTEVYRAF